MGSQLPEFPGSAAFFGGRLVSGCHRRMYTSGPAPNRTRQKCYLLSCCDSTRHGEIPHGEILVEGTELSPKRDSLPERSSSCNNQQLQPVVRLAPVNVPSAAVSVAPEGCGRRWRGLTRRQASLLRREERIRREVVMAVEKTPPAAKPQLQPQLLPRSCHQS